MAISKADFKQLQAEKRELIMRVEALTTELEAARAEIGKRSNPGKPTVDQRMTMDREIARRIRKAEERAARAEAKLAEMTNGDPV